MSSTSASVLSVVRELAESRLVEMGHAVAPVDGARLRGQFDRVTSVQPSVTYEVGVAGAPCALTVWSIGTTPDPGIDEALDAEVTDLRAGGRQVAHSIHVFEDVLTLRCELLAARVDDVADVDLGGPLRSMLQQFWEPRPIVRRLISRVRQATLIPEAGLDAGRDER